ncbi:hypothetical protein [Marinivivus vitaminiproducens]|uniref:hypothetical protein n=1 Tax=Marinivivus vitaminiproducens TaxID=3035935 RepID=UPI00279FBFA7|nr:hypothetical protein P4R82_11205 [Geminicoccaceae bacterium SCSIO 64248]
MRLLPTILLFGALVACARTGELPATQAGAALAGRCPDGASGPTVDIPGSSFSGVQVPALVALSPDGQRLADATAPTANDRALAMRLADRIPRTLWAVSIVEGGASFGPDGDGGGSYSRLYVQFRDWTPLRPSPPDGCTIPPTLVRASLHENAYAVQSVTITPERTAVLLQARAVDPRRPRWLTTDAAASLGQWRYPAAMGAMTGEGATVRTGGLFFARSFTLAAPDVPARACVAFTGTSTDQRLDGYVCDRDRARFDDEAIRELIASIRARGFLSA